jgi:hypothetical protein
VAHTVCRKIDPVPGGILFDIPKDIRELEGLSQCIGIRSKSDKITTEDRNAGPTDGAGCKIAVFPELSHPRNPDPVKVHRHSPDNIEKDPGRNPATLHQVMKPRRERMVESCSPGKVLCPGGKFSCGILSRKRLVNQIIHNTEKDVEGFKIFSGLILQKPVSDPEVAPGKSRLCFFVSSDGKGFGLSQGGKSSGKIGEKRIVTRYRIPKMLPWEGQKSNPGGLFQAKRAIGLPFYRPENLKRSSFQDPALLKSVQPSLKSLISSD